MDATGTSLLEEETCRSKAAQKVYGIPEVYRIEVGLLDNPLRALNVYVIKSEGSALIIDTGFNAQECYEDLTSGLHSLDLDPARTSLFISHGHVDHVGLVNRLSDRVARIYMNYEDYGLVRDTVAGHWWGRTSTLLKQDGFTEREAETMCIQNPVLRYLPEEPFDFIDVQDGDEITVGSLDLRCIATPGHTSGHMCLYEPGEKLFFSGDHVLFDISPNIVAWSSDRWPDSLGAYLDSLQKVRNLECSMVFPGHRSPAPSLKERVDELLLHHEKRLEECAAVLRERAACTCQDVAKNITWHIVGTGWDDYPESQKLFAENETRAHLEHLVTLGKVNKALDDGLCLYALAAD